MAAIAVVAAKAAVAAIAVVEVKAAIAAVVTMVAKAAMAGESGGARNPTRRLKGAKGPPPAVNGSRNSRISIAVSTGTLPGTS